MRSEREREEFFGSWIYTREVSGELWPQAYLLRLPMLVAVL